MFQIGDFIVYGYSGVCEITSIDYPTIPINDGEKRLYYKLSPVYSTEVIYTPVDTKVYMRSIVTCEQAKQLIGEISRDIKISAKEKKYTHVEYNDLLKTQECEDLVRMIKIIHSKKNDCLQSGKKMTSTDQKYLKQAEELLCNELSVALGNDMQTMKSVVDDALSEWVLKLTS